MGDIGLGVVIVAFNSGDEVVDCVETLLAAAAAAGVFLRVAVVDNGSTDDTAERVRAWAAGSRPWAVPGDLPFEVTSVAKPQILAEGGPEMAAAAEAPVALIDSGANRGFAGGVNVGLAYLARFPGLRHFWVLNPDSVVPPEALAALAATLPGAAPYALMGGRVTYLDPPDMIQIDGGTVNRWTGVTGNLNLGASHAATPEPAASAMDFVMGASMIASRAFYETAGPMREDYFLYYEEVDWAMRRGDLPLARCPGLRIFHRAGSAIGSPTLSRLASPFSLYFKHRGRMMYLRRFHRAGVPTGWAYSLAYAARLLLKHRAPAEARAVLAGAFGLPAPRAIAERLGSAAAAIAFGRG